MDKEAEAQQDGGRVPWLCSCRLGLALMAFFGFLAIYTQRVGMSVAIVCMVNHTALSMRHQPSLPLAPDSLLNDSLALGSGSDVAYETLNSTLMTLTEDTCQLSAAAGQDTKDGPFVWEKTQQGHLLGAFFYGYLSSQIPGGLLAERFGGKWVYAGFFALSTLGTMLSPAAARLHYGALIAMRVLVGVGSGAVFPVMHSIWGKWAPPKERSKLAGISYAGAMMGNVVALPLSGILCEYGFDEGWGSIFYIFGVFSVLWLGLWCLLVGDSPAGCSRISPQEKSYISRSLKGQVSEVSNPPTPWRQALRSGPVWAIIVCNFATDWGLYTFLTNIPTYMFEVLHFDMQSNGLYSALPFLALWVNMNVSPLLADRMLTSAVHTTKVRKLFNTIGMLGSAACLVSVAFVPCHLGLVAIGLLTAGVGVMGSSYSGFLVNHMDIAPAFAGTLFGLSNCLGACSGFIAPYVAAVITQDQSRESWQVVFFVTAGLLTVGAVVYLLLGSGDLQPWALPPQPLSLEVKPLNLANGLKDQEAANGLKEGEGANGLKPAENGLYSRVATEDV